MTLTIHIVGLCGVVSEGTGDTRNFYVVPLAGHGHKAMLSIPAAAIDSSLQDWPEWCPICPSVSPDGQDVANIDLKNIVVQIVDGNHQELDGGVICLDRLQGEKKERPHKLDQPDLHWLIDTTALHESELGGQLAEPRREVVEGTVTSLIASIIRLRRGSFECSTPFREVLYEITNETTNGPDTDRQRQVFVDSALFSLNENGPVGLLFVKGNQTFVAMLAGSATTASVWNLGHPGNRDQNEHFKTYHALLAKENLKPKRLTVIDDGSSGPRTQGGRPINCVPLALYRSNGSSQ